GGDEDHGPFTVLSLNLAEYVQPGTVREMKIEDNNIGPVLMKQVKPCGSGACGQHLDLVLLKNVSKRVANALLVVDHQNRGHGLILVGRSRQRDTEACAADHVFGLDVAAVLLNDAIANAQPQTATGWLRARERGK